MTTNEAEFVHVRHPLLLLARHLEKDLLTGRSVVLRSGSIGCGERSNNAGLGHRVSGGYTNRVELLCAAVDCAGGVAEPIAVERAQEMLRAVSDAPSSALRGDFDVEGLKVTAEEVLLGQFKGVSDAFGSRDNLLTEKAKQAVRSHAQRQIARNKRQLQREDLNINLRNMYLGWNRRI